MSPLVNHLIRRPREAHDLHVRLDVDRNLSRFPLRYRLDREGVVRGSTAVTGPVIGVSSAHEMICASSLLAGWPMQPRCRPRWPRSKRHGERCAHRRADRYVHGASLGHVVARLNSSCSAQLDRAGSRHVPSPACTPDRSCVEASCAPCFWCRCSWRFSDTSLRCRRRLISLSPRRSYPTSRPGMTRKRPTSRPAMPRPRARCRGSPAPTAAKWPWQRCRRRLYGRRCRRPSLRPLLGRVVPAQTRPCSCCTCLS